MSERYEIQGRLGRGGMSAIYRAYDRVMGRDVAIKRLLPVEETRLNEEATAALQREASALSRFQHPNVVTVYALEEDEDGPYVVMELIEGQDLNSVMKSGALSYDDFKDIAAQCLEPLMAANEVSLLHRDIKPGNIMLTLTSSGRFLVKILDFGLAKFSLQPSIQTLDQSGSFLGSIDYIAPEQLELRPLDQRTDLYSLGCVLYYSLAQKGPFTGETPARTSMNHLEHNCRHIREIRPDIPQPVGDWLMKMISRSVGDRPANAAEAMAMLKAAIAGMEEEEDIPIAKVAAPPSAPMPEPAPPTEPPTGKPATSGLRPHRPPTGSPRPSGPITGRQSSVPSGPQVPVMSNTGRQRAVIRTATGEIKPVPRTGSTPTSRAPSRPVKRASEPAPETPWYGNRFVWIGAGGALVLAVLGIVWFTGGKKESIPEEPEKEEPEVVENVPLPLPAGLPSSRSWSAPPALPVEAGLVARYAAGSGTLGRDYETSAPDGQPVALWVNLEKETLPASLFRDTTDKFGQYLPYLKTYGPGHSPYLKREVTVAELSNLSFLGTRPGGVNAANGVSVVAMVRLESGAGRFLQLMSTKQRGKWLNFSVDFSGQLIATLRYDEQSKDPRVTAVWSDGDFGVFGYSWNPGKGEHVLVTREEGDSKVYQTTEPSSDKPIPFNRFTVGKRGWNDGYTEEEIASLVEVAVYGRPLSPADLEKIVIQMAGRYIE